MKTRGDPWDDGRMYRDLSYIEASKQRDGKNFKQPIKV